MCLKPIIYLYTESQTQVEVKLGKPDKITTSYPKYTNSGWKVIANPDGNLIDTSTGRSLYALYWEGKDTLKISEEDGFVVKGENVEKFLEERLDILGLTEREAEEFIVYWLPKLEKNKYNFIRFETLEKLKEVIELIKELDNFVSKNEEDYSLDTLTLPCAYEDNEYFAKIDITKEFEEELEINVAKIF